MAKTSTFACSVITPERAVLECDATFMAMPAHDGEIGVLVHRAPLVCKLGVGALRVDFPTGKHRLLIDGGFAQIYEDRVSILTQEARPADELNAAAAEQAYVEARAMKITSDASWSARDRAMRRARVAVALARSKR